MAKKSFTFPVLPDDIAPAAPPVDLQILQKTVDDGVRELEGARMIAIDRIRPDPSQPRRDIDGEALEDLARSIKQEGVLQPLLVRYRYEEDDFMIIAGERRYRAAQIAGLKEVPAIIRNIGATQRYVLQLMENLQREDLNAVDKGRALDHLKTIMPGNWQVMADLVGLTRRRLEQLRALQKLPAPIQDAVRTNAITEDHARSIGRLPEALHEPVMAIVQREGLNTRRTKALVQRVQDSLRQYGGPEAFTEGQESARGSTATDVVLAAADQMLRSETVRGPRSRLAIPVYEKALEFERVLDRMPVLEFQEDRTLLKGIFERIQDKLMRIGGEDLSSS